MNIISRRDIKVVWRLLVGIELFLMMWATDELFVLKLLLLICITAISVIDICRYPILTSKYVVVWMLCYVIANIFFTVISILYNNEGALVYLNVDILEPIIFFVIIISIDEKDFEFLKKVLVYSSSFLYLYLFIGFLEVNGFLPKVFHNGMIFIFADYGGVLPFGLMKADANYTAWFYFLIPASILLFFYKDEVKNRMLKITAFINFVLSLLSVVLVLKTALVLVVVFSFSIVLVFVKFRDNNCITRGKVIKWLMLFVLFVFAWFYFDIGGFIEETILRKVLISFNVSESYVNEYGVVDGGAGIRETQIKALLETWQKKPLLGWGVGANAEGYGRGGVPGAYEMTYFAKLMQRGFVGIIIYVGMLCSLYVKTFLFIRMRNVYKVENLYVMTGLTGMLIANATNPYLESFDRLIILFLPLLIINLSYKKVKLINSTDIT